MKKKVSIVAGALAFLLAAPLTSAAQQELMWYPMENSATPAQVAPPAAAQNSADYSKMMDLIQSMNASPKQDAVLSSMLQQQQTMNLLLANMMQQQQANQQANLLASFMSMTPSQQQALLAFLALPQNQQQKILGRDPSSHNTTPAIATTPPAGLLPPPAALPSQSAAAPSASPAPTPVSKEKNMSVPPAVQTDISPSSRLDRLVASILNFDVGDTVSAPIELPATPAQPVLVSAPPRKSARESIREAYQDGLDVIATGAEAGFSYSASQIFTVWCKEGYLTDIRLQPGEELQYIGGGDTVRWLVDKSVSGSGATRQWHVLLKPLRPNIETNLIINTDKHSYQLHVKTDGEGYNPMIAWVYPQEKLDEINAELGRNKKPAAAGRGTSPENLNFGYKVYPRSGTESWTPTSVYDDGKKTYLKMPAAMETGEAPVLFVKDGRNGLAIANYRLRKGVYIVDRLFNEAELRAGKNIVKIRRVAEEE